MTLNQINKIKEKLKKSLNKRKENFDQMNKTTYQEEVIEELSDGNMSKESDATIVDLMEKNHNLTKNMKSMKREKLVKSKRMWNLRMKEIS